MTRIVLSLPKQLYDDVKELAARAGQPPTDVLDDLVRQGLAARRRTLKPTSNLLELAHLGIKGGPKDLAARADDYLYGDK